MSDSPARIVMISSTCRDLPRHREEVRSACEELRCLPRMMEHLPASDAGAVGASLALVDEADVYVGVFGYRYGHVPRGEVKSVTHLEYERACARGLPILIFLMDINHRVFPADIETGEGAERLRALKAHLEAGKDHVVKYFRSPKDLHAKVLLSLGEHLSGAAQGASRPAAPSLRPTEPLPAAPLPAVDPQALRAARRQLFRIEAQARSDSARHQLIVNLGFSRVWVRDASGRRLPVVCGCAMARSEVRFQGGRSNADPSCAALPPEARLVVEFGTGPRPVVRLEACPPRPFLEGRTQLVFEVKQDTIVAGAMPPGPLSGVITIEPEWFAAERPAGATGQPAITEEVEALLNAWLYGLQRQRPAVHSFTLG
jgi:hypothetical protein